MIFFISLTTNQKVWSFWSSSLALEYGLDYLYRIHQIKFFLCQIQIYWNSHLELVFPWVYFIQSLGDSYVWIKAPFLKNNPWKTYSSLLNSIIRLMKPQSMLLIRSLLMENSINNLNALKDSGKGIMSLPGPCFLLSQVVFFIKCSKLQPRTIGLMTSNVVKVALS